MRSMPRSARRIPANYCRDNLNRSRSRPTHSMPGSFDPSIYPLIDHLIDLLIDHLGTAPAAFPCGYRGGQLFPIGAFTMRRLFALCAASSLALSALALTSPAQAAPYHL